MKALSQPSNFRAVLGPTVLSIVTVLFLASLAPDLAARHNVLIILADDMGWKDVGFNGSEIQTPNIDRLAEEGVKLTRYYAQSTCSPTRASLMTGQAALRNGVLRPIDKNSTGGLPLDLKILPQYFAEAGYQTSLIGKWHLGHAYRAQLPTARGFDHAYGNLLGGIGQWSHIHGGGLDWQRDGVALREEGYSTHLLVDDTIRQIENRDAERPFFYYLSLTAPHLPNEAPNTTVEKYAEIERTQRRMHAAMVDEIDQGVGRILAALEQQGVMDDTLIWFMSDNGGLIEGSGISILDGALAKLSDWFGTPLPVEALEFFRTNIQDGGSDNGPYRRGKGSVYEGGVLVPSVLYWSGVLKGREINQRVTAQDVLPTLADAAQLTLDDSMPLDGRNQWQLFLGSEEFGPVDYAIAGIEGEAYYQGDWKLVLPRGEAPQLYDLSRDLTETHDLAAEEPQRVQLMRDKLAALPEGESIHKTSWLDMILDPDIFGGVEDRPPWVERLRD